MKLHYLGALFGIALSIASGTARAELLHFQYQGSEDFSFNLDSEQKPSSYNGYYAAYDDVVFSIAGNGEKTARVEFNAPENDGEFTAYLTPTLATEGFGTIFSGPTDDPTFHVGTFQLFEVEGGGESLLTVSSVPLPASAPMFGAALLGLVGISYAARRKTVAAAA